MIRDEQSAFWTNLDLALTLLYPFACSQNLLRLVSKTPSSSRYLCKRYSYSLYARTKARRILVVLRMTTDPYDICRIRKEKNPKVQGNQAQYPFL